MDATNNSLIPQEYRDILRPSSLRAVEIQLSKLPPDQREDALQEAVLAHLTIASPAARVRNFRGAERRHAQRETPNSQLAPRDA